MADVEEVESGTDLDVCLGINFPDRVGKVNEGNADAAADVGRAMLTFSAKQART
jgi:hypothetical protein